MGEAAGGVVFCISGPLIEMGMTNERIYEGGKPLPCLGLLEAPKPQPYSLEHMGSSV